MGVCVHVRVHSNTHLSCLCFSVCGGFYYFYFLLLLLYYYYYYYIIIILLLSVCVRVYLFVCCTDRINNFSLRRAYGRGDRECVSGVHSYLCSWSW